MAATVSGAIRAVRPLDRLAIITLLSSLYFFQVWGFAELRTSQSVLTPDNILGLSLIAVSLIGVLASHLTIVLFVNALFFFVIYALHSPVASNNQTMAAFFSLTVLVASAPLLIRHRFQLWKIDREALFTAIAGPGRWILAVMYFYGIYHKINADFINPEVSCGVVLYKHLAANFGLAEWRFGHYAAIWGTFIIETVAMVLLFSNRFKKIGFMVGIPFHVAIGWTSYGYYMDFSTIVMTTYALFLPAAAPRAAFAAAARIAGGEARALLMGRILMIAGVIAALLSIGVLDGWRNLRPEWARYVGMFTIYAGVFYLFVLFFVPWRVEDNLPVFNFKPRFAAIVPILFFINGASPYLGLKTESSIAMFSNLHTEGRETNHYLTGVLPFGAHYQDDVVRIVSISDPRVLEVFDSRSGERGIGDQIGFVRFEFDRMLARHPDLKVTFMHDGVVRMNDDTWENTYLRASWLEKHFLMFKPVDFERPKICTH